MVKYKIPSFFQKLIDGKLIGEDDILFTEDNFSMVRSSVSSILTAGRIETFPDRDGTILECRNFFDDWFLFAVPDQNDYVYGLLKMREQEHDLEWGIRADGDTPGVTVSFIAFDTGVMQACLQDPSADNRKKLGIEINRTVAYPKQNHHPALKAYFIRPQAEAPYLVAQTYVNHIASLCVDGVLDVPEAYKEIFRKRAASPKYARIPDFLDRNNQDANVLVCDHEKIYIRNAECLSRQEKSAILVTHTGNTTEHSFAAEIRYHAMFLIKLAKIRLPVGGCPYASAVRADMSIADREHQGPTPYYNHSGRMIAAQIKHHAGSFDEQDRKFE